MAKNRYKCNQCSNEEIKYTAIKEYACECGGCMNRQMPKLSGEAQVNEVVDKYRNIKHKSYQKKTIQDRKLVHYWKVKVPQMVNSGVYSLQTMIEMGWVYYNEKEELCTRTSPPAAK